MFPHRFPQSTIHSAVDAAEALAVKVRQRLLYSSSALKTQGSHLEEGEASLVRITCFGLFDKATETAILAWDRRHLMMPRRLDRRLLWRIFLEMYLLLFFVLVVWVSKLRLQYFHHRLMGRLVCEGNANTIYCINKTEPKTQKDEGQKRNKTKPKGHQDKRKRKL